MSKQKTENEKLKILRANAASKETIEAMKEAVLRGDCPLCGKSGFKLIAMHTNRTHGIDTRELRDLLGMTYTESICAPELHEQLSELNSGKRPRDGGEPKAPQQISKQGRENRRKAMSEVQKAYRHAQ